MKFSHFKFKVSLFWYKHIECLFFPKQQWLHKIIPRTFVDIDTLIENITFECLINFWEKDEGGKMLRLQYTMFEDSPEQFSFMTEQELFGMKELSKMVYDDVYAAYQWAVTRKSVDEDSIERINNDTKYLQTIIQYRQGLWT